ncbi:hypothetical protein SAMN02910327_00192 [Peptostreptococcaceae bacterium pGA-8]|nr:hypothetical protein SAMN02910327_00192 [Peptostreptococcaceae bacterium pGA-8]
MVNMKRIYNTAVIYTTIMAIGIFICKQFKNVSYLDSNFINTFIPFLIALTPFSVICYKKYNENVGNHKSKHTIFMLLFTPVILISLFTIMKKFEFSNLFFIPLVGALLVGLNEELIYRGVIFTNVTEEKGLKKGIFISAFLFSLLHTVNILGGLSFSQVATQLVTTFIAGIFLALSYRNTKNIWLLVVYHGLWDYISLSGIGKIYPIVDIIVVILSIVELTVSLVLLKNIRKKSISVIKN